MLLQLDLPGFDFREVENVVDDVQKIVAGAAKHAHVLALFVVERRFRQQLRHAQQRVHGRADFVTHAGQKFALGLR